MSAQHTIEVHSKTPPVVELDSTAHAAYIRFSRAKVFKTKMVTCDREVITVDLAKDGSVIGVELIGITEFTIGPLLKASRISAPQELVKNTRYVSAKRSNLATVGC